MNLKCLLLTLFALMCSATVFSQRHEILITHQNNKTTVIKAGEMVRIAYPRNKLNLEHKFKGEEAGLRGLIDSISKETVFLKIRKGAKDNLALNVKDITAIQKSDFGGTLGVFLLSYAVLGGSAIALTESLDVNPAITAFSAVAAIFPASIITVNMFYPSKPKKRVGKDYKLDMITVY
ncbi:hypothetical protein FYC62_12680 [Pedobacter aquae]|uniref:Uncharacterized protein n=1 Tax=Pedobacter aquae TaxID=2605747 RepID=A0A5C0VKL9_9SPHI|nr:hypothetical protein [Pedobacter aquae]QEK52412.1 hypothetical protein FYC62_12680 [Pedobacter aquae]